MGSTWGSWGKEEKNNEKVMNYCKLTNSRRTLQVTSLALARGQKAPLTPAKTNWLVDISQTKKSPVPISFYEERKLANDIERQIDQVRADLAQLETDRIRGLIQEELAKTQTFEYFYGWSIEEYFFGLVQSHHREIFQSPSYQQFSLGSGAKPISYGAMVERVKYHRQMIAFNRNPDSAMAHFDETFIPIELISIHKKSGAVSLHFYKSFFLSFILHLSIESSNLCDVCSLTNDPNESNLPSNKNAFIVKVPLPNARHLRLYCQFNLVDLLSVDENRRLLNSNPVTERMVSSMLL